MNAGEIPLMVTALGVPETSGALPMTIRALVEIAVFPHVEVVPQADIAGIFPAVNVPPALASPCMILMFVPLIANRGFVLTSEPNVRPVNTVPVLV